MINHIKRLFNILTLLLLLTGCWGRTEVDNIAIVNAIGVDLIDRNFIKVTLLLAVPRLIGNSAGGGGADSKLEASSGWVVSEEARSVMEAFDKLQRKLPRKIFFSHNRVIVLGERLAKNGTLPTLDFFMRNRQSQIRSNIMVSKSDASDVLKFKPKFEKLASEVMKAELKMSHLNFITLGRFYNMVMEEGQEAYIPQIMFVPSAGKESDLNNLIVSRSTAVFKGDRLVGRLDEKEAMALLWVRNDMHDGVVTVNLPQDVGGGYVSGEFENLKSKISPTIQNGALEKIEVALTTSLKISENTSNLDLHLIDNKKIVSNLFANEVKDRVEMLCKKIQKQQHSDILGLGQTLFQENSQIWNAYAPDWDTLFSDIQVDVYAKVQIVQTGLIGKDGQRGE